MLTVYRSWQTIPISRRPIHRRRSAIIASGGGWVLRTSWWVCVSDCSVGYGLVGLVAGHCFPAGISKLFPVAFHVPAVLLVISKVLGIGLDYYGFALERRFKLSTQRFQSPGFGMSSRVSCWVWSWGPWWWKCCTLRCGSGLSIGGCWRGRLFMGLFIMLAQLAPVVLFPIFYKFEPLDNEDLRRAWWC